MFKLIKQTYSDLTEFFLALLTGVFAGSIFTLAYVKFWEKGDITFADIGGMLAGAATVGLLCLALRAKDEWNIQNKISLKQNTMIELQNLLNNYFNKGILYGFSVQKMQEAKEERSNDEVSEQLINTRFNELRKENTRIFDDFINLAGKINAQVAIYKAIYQASPPHDLTLEKKDKIDSMLGLGIDLEADKFITLMQSYRKNSEKAFIHELNQIIK